MTAPSDRIARVPAFFGAAFAWNLALGMTHILIPLYADHLGFSGVAIGSLVSLPVLVQIAFNLIGGAWTDRAGGKRLALVSAAAFGVAGVVFALASTYAALFFGQLCIIVSRAMFWPATWSLGSQLPGDRSAGLGRLNSTTNAGQIVGTIVAGLDDRLVRVRRRVLGSRAGRRRGGVRVDGGVRGAGTARRRVGAPADPGGLSRAGAAALDLVRGRLRVLSALPFSIGMSFYPLLLVGRASPATRPAGCSRCAPWGRLPPGSPRRVSCAGWPCERSRS